MNGRQELQTAPRRDCDAVFHPSEWGKRTSWEKGGFIDARVENRLKNMEKKERELKMKNKNKRKRVQHKTAEEFFIEKHCVRTHPPSISQPRPACGARGPGVRKRMARLLSVCDSCPFPPKFSYLQLKYKDKGLSELELVECAKRKWAKISDDDTNDDVRTCKGEWRSPAVVRWPYANCPFPLASSRPTRRLAPHLRRARGEPED